MDFFLVTRRFEVNNHAQLTEDSHRDWSSQRIGAGIVKAFVERGFSVVANSRKVTQSTEVAASDHVALVDGDISERRG
jgi:hypothetical protein